ncbi:Bactericidal/permeability-increasing protein-like 2 [Myotis davidii]|uniref:Bactericidal permeability-increasing protein n=1 Tax=Myotis davidii TaxID=225400 RepID=L5LIV3_MYODS|nr:Bactericidal/permeability-increasing protein-like 2 [Myotis davidii]
MMVNPVRNDMAREAVTERTLELALEDPKTILTPTPVSSPRHIPIITYVYKDGPSPLGVFPPVECLHLICLDHTPWNQGKDYSAGSGLCIKINALSFPNTSLAFVPGVGVKALTNHGTANISTHWEVKSPLFQDSGGADLFLSGVYFAGILTLTRNDLGQPNLELQDCHAQVSHAHVSFSGELSVLYNSFAEPMEKPILKNLNEMLCPIITGEVEALNANLSMLEVLTKIDNYTLLDYSLMSSPEITENYIDLNLKGAFYPLENLADPPFSPVPFELPERSDSMLYIGISEYFFKSASFAHFAAGAFNVTLSTKEISSHLVRNSQGVGNILSRIAEIYILSQPFMVRIMATEPPVISLLPGNFTLDIPASIMLLTQSENSTAETIVSMDFVASTSVGLVILGQRLICSLSLNRFRLSLPESNRDNIESSDPTQIQHVFQYCKHFQSKRELGRAKNCWI